MKIQVFQLIGDVEEPLAFGVLQECTSTGSPINPGWGVECDGDGYCEVPTNLLIQYVLVQQTSLGISAKVSYDYLIDDTVLYIEDSGHLLNEVVITPKNNNWIWLLLGLIPIFKK